MPRPRNIFETFKLSVLSELFIDFTKNSTHHLKFRKPVFIQIAHSTFDLEEKHQITRSSTWSSALKWITFSRIMFSAQNNRRSINILSPCQPNTEILLSLCWWSLSRLGLCWYVYKDLLITDAFIVSLPLKPKQLTIVNFPRRLLCRRPKESQCTTESEHRA